MFKDNIIKKFNVTIIISLLFTLFNGAIRKWGNFGPSFGIILQLIQLCLPLVIVFINGGLKKPWNLWEIKFFLFCLIILAFNPLNLTLYHGLLGIVIYSPFFIVFFFYFINRDKFNFKPIYNILLIFILFEFILGFIQYQLPPDNFLNKYADMERFGGGDLVSMVGNSVRITGTFSYISGFTSFLIFVSLFTWVLIRENYNANIIAILIILNFSAALMSGSRAAVLTNLIYFSLIIKSEFNLQIFFFFIRKMIIPLIVILLVVLINGKIGLEDKILNAFDNFNERRVENATSGEQDMRIINDINDLIKFHGNYPIFGVGLGSTYQGATTLFGTSDYVTEYGYYEGELPRIVIEGGVFLLIIRIIILFKVISLLSINRYSRVVIFILIIYSGSFVFNTYTSFFYLLGLILLDNSTNNNLNQLLKI